MKYRRVKRQDPIKIDDPDIQAAFAACEGDAPLPSDKVVVSDKQISEVIERDTGLPSKLRLWLQCFTVQVRGTDTMLWQRMAGRAVVTLPPFLRPRHQAQRLDAFVFQVTARSLALRKFKDCVVGVANSQGQPDSPPKTLGSIRRCIETPFT